MTCAPICQFTVTTDFRDPQVRGSAVCDRWLVERWMLPFVEASLRAGGRGRPLDRWAHFMLHSQPKEAQQAYRASGCRQDDTVRNRHRGQMAERWRLTC